MTDRWAGLDCQYCGDRGLVDAPCPKCRPTAFDWDELQRLREASSQAAKEAIGALQELAAFLGRDC